MRALHAVVAIDGRDVELAGSVGVAWTRESIDPDTLVACADKAMYASKRRRDHAPTVVTANREPNVTNACPSPRPDRGTPAGWQSSASAHNVRTPAVNTVDPHAAAG